MGWTLTTSHFWGVAEVFCNEVAVLWFVFPLLDSVYDSAKDKPPPTLSSIGLSFVVAFVFFALALFCKSRERTLEAKENDERVA
jgi:hypothetical protein